MKPCIVELKLKDTEELKWKKALSSYLKRVYGVQQWSQFFDEKLASELDHIRNNSNGELALDTLLEQNYTYYAYLEQLNQRLGNSTALLKIDFVWYDAEYTLSNEAQKYKQHTLVFEKSATLYNIAVLLNNAAKEKIDSDYKTAISYLSKATMCFQFLSENFLNSPSIDIQAESTQFLSNLCHSEAQEMFMMKLINGPTAEKQASLISKLALATHNGYEKCISFQKKPDGGLAPYGEPRWSTIVTCKVNFFRAVAAYYHGVALEQQNKTGEAIAFLKLAVNSVINSLAFKAWLMDFIDFEGFKETVELKLQQLIKDNDYIYHESIPQSVSVESIKPMDAIKAPTWPEQLAPFNNDVMKKTNVLYKGIVPMEAYEKESIYSDQKDSLLRRETDAAETANFEYKSFIDYTNLDSLVRDLENKYRNGNTVGAFDTIVTQMRDSLSQLSTNVQKSNFKDISQAMNDIAAKRREVTGVLATLPSDQKENGVKLKTSLIDASKSDDKLFSVVKPYADEIKLLGNPEKLWSNFNTYNTKSSSQPSLLDVDDTQTTAILSNINEIKQGSEALRVLNGERSEILSELKDKINEDDITSLVIATTNNSDDLKELFAKELEKFSPLSSRLEATVFKQTSLINDIKVKLDEIFSISGLKDRASEEATNEKNRRMFYEKLEAASVAFSNFNKDIIKGLQFYDSLLKMSKELVQASALNSAHNGNEGGNSSALPPPLPEQSGNNNVESNGFISLDSQMNNMSLNSPVIPSRTYSIPQPPPYSSMAPPIPVPGSYNSISNGINQQPPAGMTPMVPQRPPKEAPFGMNGLMARREQTAQEEAELQRNPTAFYDKSSVFDENLYSKYSK
ncbi:similar to Saccharomyces cerevisiae YPL084W BRO1 Cytoplasmic class E vacuolar protein sorting (VPS) factor [Maudiozyma barnettii]|uniref:BRO domain-containing protein 1 n=1 Tax=Maudiozyma barnettii TaxID=61262 RepID=A0A8H2VDW4_9SACH|nr:Bro1p [Kazachstania barnettii]CAB4253675.1 similar to Saccharomyces cerevisiae YPL084W BRO1 Cytoplasmic class E vacuolar protein sorting (VPS) factor [Kazachstania barnettii]CAD1781384.1 similar to Saccharomyces cerevisiae YPL084W BRO1 Cytoplasmic class E vacuolar protein sorting (VPS) factor [Kazachstania barnettii]